MTESASKRSAMVAAPELGRRTPLWTYVLAEATASAFPVRGGRITGPQVAPFRLGRVGGCIVRRPSRACCRPTPTR